MGAKGGKFEKQFSELKLDNLDVQKYVNELKDAKELSNYSTLFNKEAVKHAKKIDSPTALRDKCRGEVQKKKKEEQNALKFIGSKLPADDIESKVKEVKIDDIPEKQRAKALGQAKEFLTNKCADEVLNNICLVWASNVANNENGDKSEIAPREKSIPSKDAQPKKSTLKHSSNRKETVSTNVGFSGKESEGEDAALELAQKIQNAPARFIIAGPPGAGKSTVSKRMLSDFGVVTVGTGDLLREEIVQGTDVGHQAKELMDKGEYVPEDLFIPLLKNRLAQEDCLKGGWMVDGAPRKKEQVAMLQDLGIKPTKFFLLELPGEVAVERLSNRRLDKETGEIYHLKNNPPPESVPADRLVQRSDDKEEVIKNRYELFSKHFADVESWYKGAVVVRIDANRSPDEVYQEIKSIVESEIGAGKTRGKTITNPAEAAKAFVASPAKVLGAPVHQVFALEQGKTLRDALNLMVDKHIVACPVYDGDETNYKGLISIKAVVRAIIKEFCTVAAVQDKTLEEKEQAMEKFDFSDGHVKTITSNFDALLVKDHIDIQLDPLQEGCTVQEVLTALRSHYRVPVVDANKNIVTTYSQAVVIDYLSKHPEKMGISGDKTLGELGCFTKPVKTVMAARRTLIPFSIMAEKGYSSLGIVDKDEDDEDDEEMFVGVISFKDIKAAKDDFSQLFKMQCRDFINEIRRTDKKNMMKDVVATVNVSEGDKLNRATKKLTTVGIHRLFVKNPSGSGFEGIMTNSDILKAVLKGLE